MRLFKIFALNIQVIVDTPTTAVGIYAGAAATAFSNLVKSYSFLRSASSIIFNALGVALTANTVVATTPAAPIQVNIVGAFFLINKVVWCNMIVHHLSKLLITKQNIFKLTFYQNKFPIVPLI